MKRRPPAFVRWLRKRTDRDDPVGALASDFLADQRLGSCAPTWMRRLDHYETFLRGENAEPGLHEALRLAWAEYQAEKAAMRDPPVGQCLVCAIPLTLSTVGGYGDGMQLCFPCANRSSLDRSVRP